MSGKLFIFFSTFVFCVNTHAQHNYLRLKEADSLFNIKKYSNAYEIYQNIYTSNRQYSPQMLLKMGYIKESDGDFTTSLYHLNQFYNFHPERQILKKMEDIADRHRLEGYRYTDLEYFISIYNRYFYYIIFFILLVVLFFFFYLIIKKVLKRNLGLRPLLFFIILSMAYYFTNYSIIPTQAIIKNNHSYLMSSPSAGGDLVFMLDQGHKVTILEKNDIWRKINWQNKDVYIRECNLLLLAE